MTGPGLCKAEIGEEQMKALVLGGNRFVGARVVSGLLEAGIQVRLLNRGSHTVPPPVSPLLQYRRLDRRDPASLAAAVSDENWDVVYDFCCYQPGEAADSARIFRGRVRKYILISSQSVYRPGIDIPESEFDPFTVPPHEPYSNALGYADGKRQAEAALFQAAEFPVLAVRFPIILGEDDYTKRLHFHVERVRDGRRICIPNLEARISFVSSRDAAEFLLWVRGSAVAGPMNVASPGPVSMRELMRWIETATRKKAILVPHEDDPTIRSPFGIEKDWFMRTERVARAGYECRAIRLWMPELIEKLTRP